ncbi:MAG: hypothetical protein ACLUOI_02865 [Eisenbergiella sp.]
MMGGLIELDSEEGEGSEFYFSLRQEKGTMPENRANGEAKEEKTKLEGKRVLLVEDNELNRKSPRRFWRCRSASRFRETARRPWIRSGKAKRTIMT